MTEKTGNMKAVDVLLTSGTIVTQNSGREIIENGSIAVKDDLIIDIGTNEDITSKYRAVRTIDASNQYVFPGLINTHTHLLQTYMKGLGEGLHLYEWVESVTAPTTTAMTIRDGYLAASLGLFESLRSGTTTVLDYMYSLPSPEVYYQIASAFNDIGVRGILGWGFQDAGEDFGLPASLFRPVKESLKDFSGFRKKQTNSILSAAIAPGIIFGCSREGLEALSGYASDNQVLITSHINETPDDDAAAMKTHKNRNIPFLNDIGFLGPNLLAVHCVNMEEQDLELLLKNDVKVSHNPVSNMYLGSGAAPIVEMRRKGISVGLATDGAASNNTQDMLEVLKTAGLLSKLSNRDPSAISAQDVLDMATIEGAKTLGQEARIGSLEKGKKADLFIFDPLHPRSIPVHDPVTTLVFSSGQECIKTVMVDGKIVLEDHQIKLVNEREILLESQSFATALSQQLGTDRLRR